MTIYFSDIKNTTLKGKEIAGEKSTNAASEESTIKADEKSTSDAEAKSTSEAEAKSTIESEAKSTTAGELSPLENPAIKKILYFNKVRTHRFSSYTIFSTLNIARTGHLRVFLYPLSAIGYLRVCFSFLKWHSAKHSFPSQLPVQAKVMKSSRFSKVFMQMKEKNIRVIKGLFSLQEHQNSEK